MSYDNRTALSAGVSEDVESTLPANETMTPTEAKNKKPKNPYAFSVWIMILINFLDNITFAISIPSLYYFIEDFGGTKQFYGWCVAIYSIGQFVGAPIFGFWSNHRPYREVMITTLALEILANVTYCFSVNKWMVLTSRLVIGFAGGNIAVTRSYISAATDPEERTSAMGFVAIAQVLGFVAGPGIAAGLARIPEFTLIGPVRIGPYTWPGYFGAVLAWVSICLLIAFLKEIPTTLKAKMLKERADEQAKMEASKQLNKHKSDEQVRLINVDGSAINHLNNGAIDPADDRRIRPIPFILCMITYFISVSGFVVFETIATPYTKNTYGWGVIDNGLLYVGASVTSIVGFVTVKIISRFLNDRMQLILGSVIMAAGFASLIEWGSDLPVWRWLLGCGVVSFGLPMSQALVIALFSKVIHKESQGTLMGYMVSSASLASILAPIWSTFVYDHVDAAIDAGASTVFIISTAMMLVSLIVLIGGYRFLTPHPSQIEPAANKATPSSPEVQ